MWSHLKGSIAGAYVMMEKTSVSGCFVFVCDSLVEIAGVPERNSENSMRGEIDWY